MMKKLLLGGLSGMSLLAVGCGGAETKTFVSNEAIVPADAAEGEEFGQDIDEDGEVDNNLDELAGVLNLAGIDLNDAIGAAIIDGAVLIGLDVTSDDFVNSEDVEVNAYFALIDGGGTPVFDGTDQLLVDGDEFIFNGAKITGSKLTTERSNFQFALPLDPNNPTILSLENAILTGNIAADGSINEGTLSGSINAVEFAKNLNGVGDFAASLVAADAALFSGAPIACDGNAQGNDADCVDAGGVAGICTDSNNNGIATGFCVATDSTSAGLFSGLVLVLLGAGLTDGTIDVEFDEAAGDFVNNDLSALFTFNAGAPDGLVGDQFVLDLNADGTNDSIGLGIGFSAVAATR